MKWFKLRGCLPYTAIGMPALEQYRVEIEANYGLPLEALSESGGLDWYELWCVITGRPTYPIQQVDPDICKEIVLSRVIAERP